MQETNSVWEILTGKRPLLPYLKETEGGALLLFAESATKNIPVSPQIKEAIREQKKSIPPDIIRDAMTDILCSDHPEVVRYMYEAGILRDVLPEVSAVYALEQNNPHHVFSVGEHTLHTVCGVPNERCLRWAALLHDLGKSRTHTVDLHGVDHFHGHEEVSARIAESILGRLSFPKSEKETTVSLVRYHDFRPPVERAEELRRAVGQENITALLSLKEADAKAQNPALLEPKLKYIETLRAILCPKDGETDGIC